MYPIFKLTSLLMYEIEETILTKQDAKCQQMSLANCQIMYALTGIQSPLLSLCTYIHIYD